MIRAIHGVGMIGSLLVGCGSVSPNTMDALPPQQCNQSAPFGAPVKVGGVNSDSSEIDASLSPDELEIYFASNRAGNYDLYRASRASVTDSFGAPTLVLAVNSTSDNEEGPAISADGLALYFASNRPGTLGGFDLMVATRTIASAEFGAPSVVAGINSTSDDVSPYISRDGLTLWFSSARNGGVKRVFHATRATAGGTFSGAAEVGGLMALDERAVVSADELAIYFSSTRTNGLGQSDIWVARRSTLQDGFGSASNVPGANSAVLEWPSGLSADECRLYLGSNRPGTLGGYDIWVASKPQS